MESVLRYVFVGIFIVVGFVQAVSAAGTEWQQHQDMLQTRLIAASSKLSPSGKLLLAWEAKLQPGWKTYWRSPGEAGLPVRIFAAEAEQEVKYPFPERFELFGLETFGYSKYVVLPFELDVEAQLTDVDVEVDFMVCKEICVPFRTSYHVNVPSPDDISIHDEKITKWLDKVPASMGKDGAGLEIKWAKVVGPVGRQKIIAEVEADNSLSNADILAEVNDMFHFGKPKIKLLDDGHSARFVLTAMTGKNPEDLRGQKVRLTFSDGLGASIERMLNLPLGHSN